MKQIAIVCLGLFTLAYGNDHPCMQYLLDIKSDPSICAEYQDTFQRLISEVEKHPGASDCTSDEEKETNRTPIASDETTWQFIEWCHQNPNEEPSDYEEFELVRRLYAHLGAVVTQLTIQEQKEQRWYDSQEQLDQALAAAKAQEEAKLPNQVKRFIQESTTAVKEVASAIADELGQKVASAVDTVRTAPEVSRPDFEVPSF